MVASALAEAPVYEALIRGKAEGAAAARADVASFARDGLVLLDLADEAMTALCEQATTEIEAYTDMNAAARVQDGWLVSPAIRRLATQPQILSFLSDAYGRTPFPFQTLNFQRGSAQTAHSDVTHFNSDPSGFMAGVWIALEDIDPASGPLFYYPRSHLLPPMTLDNIGIGDEEVGKVAYGRRCAAYIAEQVERNGFEERRVTPRKGQAVVWSSNLLHGGAPITDPSLTRRSLVTHYFFEDCLYYTPMLTGTRLNRRAVRLPLDVATGRPRWPRRDGSRVMPHPGVVAKALSRMVRRHPMVFPRV